MDREIGQLEVLDPRGRDGHKCIDARIEKLIDAKIKNKASTLKLENASTQKWKHASTQNGKCIDVTRDEIQKWRAGRGKAKKDQWV